MRIRVTFAQRTGQSGSPSEEPQAIFCRELPDGIVYEKEFVQRLAPPSLHNEDSVDTEDEGVTAMGSESWDFIVENDSQRDFIEAVRNSEQALEYVTIDESPE